MNNRVLEFLAKGSGHFMFVAALVAVIVFLAKGSGHLMFGAMLAVIIAIIWRFIAHHSSWAEKPQSAVTLQILNSTSFSICITFSSEKYHHAWPEPGKAYVTQPGQMLNISLIGFSREKIYYSAWVPEATHVQWGKCSWMSEGDATPIATCGTAGVISISLVYNN